MIPMHRRFGSPLQSQSFGSPVRHRGHASPWDVPGYEQDSFHITQPLYLHERQERQRLSPAASPSAASQSEASPSAQVAVLVRNLSGLESRYQFLLGQSEVLSAKVMKQQSSMMSKAMTSNTVTLKRNFEAWKQYLEDTRLERQLEVQTRSLEECCKVAADLQAALMRERAARQKADEACQQTREEVCRVLVSSCDLKREMDVLAEKRRVLERKLEHVEAFHQEGLSGGMSVQQHVHTYQRQFSASGRGETVGAPTGAATPSGASEGEELQRAARVWLQRRATGGVTFAEDAWQQQHHLPASPSRPRPRPLSPQHTGQGLPAPFRFSPQGTPHSPLLRPHSPLLQWQTHGIPRPPSPMAHGPPSPMGQRAPSPMGRRSLSPMAQSPYPPNGMLMVQVPRPLSPTPAPLGMPPSGGPASVGAPPQAVGPPVLEPWLCLRTAGQDGMAMLTPQARANPHNRTRSKSPDGRSLEPWWCARRMGPDGMPTVTPQSPCR